MSKRVTALLMATCMMCSLAACNFVSKPNPAPSTSETETTEVSETTTEETTEETEATEETTSEEVTETTEDVVESSSEETSSSATAAPTNKPTKKPTAKPKKKKSSAPSVPKGWKKYDTEECWGQKMGTKRVYVIYKGSSYKGWKNGKWVKLKKVKDPDGSSGEYFYDMNGKIYAESGW